MRITKLSISVIILLFTLGYLLHGKYINEFPTYVHAWTQADRYAIALGFGNNDLNFFKPETYSLLKNSTEINGWKVEANQSITSVDFPIHDFIPGLIMKISENKSPWIFRGYILLYGFLGLFVLSKLAFLLTKDEGKSFLITVFAATSPVFVYYQSGFLPTIPCIANVIIGFYFYSKHLYNASHKDFVTSLIFLSLASLSRSPLAIPLIAVLSVEALRFLRKENDLKTKLIPIVLSIVTIIGYFAYNSYLSKTYGSVFLGNLMPATDFNDAFDIFRNIKNRWLTEYFTSFHYWLSIPIIIGGLYGLFINAPLEKEKQTLFILISINIIGCFGYSVLMLKQFTHHDYYFLDTFYVPIILLILLLISLIPTPTSKWGKYISIGAVILFAYPTILKGIELQDKRRTIHHNNRTIATTNNFEDSEAFLDSLNVPKNAQILVLDAYTTSIPFILMNRKGYPLLTTSRKNLIKSLEWNFDFVVIQNEFFVSDIFKYYPEILKRLKKLGDNGKISVCVLDDNIEDQTLSDFVEFGARKPLFESNVSFENKPDNKWENVVYTSNFHSTGDSAGILKKDDIYGIAYKSTELDVITSRAAKLYFSADFLQNGIDEITLVAAVAANKENIFYQAHDLRKLLKEKNEWEHIELLFDLPQVKSEEYEFSLYLWNRSKSQLFMDDFGFRIF
ncbi:MAG: glycosyltransferase family 39 protein [Flavobacteriales bacterium]|nr:glycosyltransferase family 39 protein [Flavobacteriales bacterium]